MLALLAVAAGCLAGRIRGGRLAGLADLGLRHLELPLVGLVALAVLHYGPGGTASPLLRAALLTASYLPVAAFLWLNRKLRPVLLIAAGLALNLAVVVPNGGMPVSGDASRAAGLTSPEDDPTVLWGKHVVMTSSTRLAPLGDVIPVPIPGFRQVVSAGDLLVLTGIGWLVAVAVRRAGREQAAPRG